MSGPHGAAPQAALSVKVVPQPPGVRGTHRMPSITDTATRLKSIEARLAELPVVDKARVEALRHKVESGSYKPDPARVAQKLMRMEQDL